MAASEDGRASDEEDDDVDDASQSAAADVNNMTDKQKRKWDKGLQKWRIFVDFLLRQVSVVTYKYNSFERDELTSFMMSLEQAETLRLQSKRKKGVTARISSITTMKESADLLSKNNLISEANRIRKYIDLVGRMRGLSTIAGGLLKALKRAKVKGYDQLKHCVDHWKGFCVRSFDYTELTILNIDMTALSDLDRRYLAWPTVLRTSIHLAQSFLRQCCDSTGLKLLNLTATEDAGPMVRHMQAGEFIVAAKLEEMLFERVLQDSTAFSLLHRTGAPVMSTLHQEQQNVIKKSWQLPPVNELDPQLLKPISETGLLLSLPAEPPKEKKKKGRKRGKKGKKSTGGKSGGRHKSGKKKKK